MTDSLLRYLIRETRIHLYALRHTTAVAFPLGKTFNERGQHGFRAREAERPTRSASLETRESFNLGPTAAAARLVTLYGEYLRSRLESLILRSN